MISRASLAVAAAAALLAALQPWTLLAIGETGTGSLAALASNPGGTRRMFLVYLAFMPAMFVAYWITVRAHAERLPVLASFASFAFALWFALELLPRSFDLWVVQGRWLTEYVAGDASARVALEQKYALYRDGLFALGFVRRNALLIGQLLLAISVWNCGWPGRLLALALGLSVARLTMGTMASYGGMSALNAIADPLYFVTASTVFPLIAVRAIMARHALAGTRPAAA